MFYFLKTAEYTQAIEVSTENRLLGNAQEVVTQYFGFIQDRNVRI